MPPRVAVYACRCCGGSSNVPLHPGQRPTARRPCPNGGCWACLGACGGTAERTEVVRLGKPPVAMQPAAPTAMGGAFGPPA